MKARLTHLAMLAALAVAAIGGKLSSFGFSDGAW